MKMHPLLFQPFQLQLQHQRIMRILPQVLQLLLIRPRVTQGLPRRNLGLPQTQVET